MRKEFCKICSINSYTIFNALVLNKYSVKYFKCSNCGMIYTEKPFWLNEAYSSAITLLDIGLLARCLLNTSRTESLILQIKDFFFPDINSISILDFAGGYGVFTRLMRDKGFDCYWQDDFCSNIFAQAFILKENTKYDLVTAFEVFEHEENPDVLLKRLLLLSDNILFSTSILPSESLSNVNDWWYFTPETGQHITFYTLESLDLLAEKNLCSFYSNGTDLHFISKNKLSYNPFKVKNNFLNKFLFKIWKFIFIKFLPQNNIGSRKSLLESDYFFVKNKINNENLL